MLRASRRLIPHRAQHGCVPSEFDDSCYFLITGLMEGKGRFGLFRTTELGLVGLMAVGAVWGFGKLDNSCFSLLTGGLDALV